MTNVISHCIFRSVAFLPTKKKSFMHEEYFFEFNSPHVAMHSIALNFRAILSHVVQVFQVAGVDAGADDEPDPAALLLPRARHEAARRVVQDGANLHVDVAATIQGLLQQTSNVLQKSQIN